MSVEINCQACGKVTLLLRNPVYEGFSKVGETLSCSECGHVFESEEDINFKEQKKVSIFTDEDRSKDPDVFKGDQVRFCRTCKHYVVNPFMQYCSFHKKEVEATDTCPQHEEKLEEDDVGSIL